WVSKATQSWGRLLDLTDVQKTVIDTLHKEGKPQKRSTVNAAIYQETLEYFMLPSAD
ncbi:hypothetical protein L3Q82_011707, partial [Scortum barcoo]